ASDGDTEQVAIFRGVNAELVGLDFYSLQEETGILVEDLNATARSSVMDGIPADDLDGAQGILDNLLDARLPLCNEPSPTSRSSATPTILSTPAVPTTVPPVGQPPAAPSGSNTSTTTDSATGSTAADRTGVTCREGN
ncbi:MAG: hypothetical protein H0X18_17235, partial [Geodermatophilaceae bacterium]|nr:hypothetical protein [Geodermatophilaceae bacterium]